MDNVYIQDVCEVFLKDLDSGKQFFFGLTSKNTVTQKIKQEDLRGGIGNGKVGTISSDKEISVKVTTLLHNDSIYEIQSGAVFGSKTMEVHKNESLKCTVAGKVTLVGTPKGSSVVCYNSKGKSIAGTYATSNFTATTPADIALGAFYTVVYVQDVTADALLLDSKKFPTNYALELHTIAYDVDTNDIVADVYWAFNKVSANGALNAQYDAGKNNGDDIEFSVSLPMGSTEYGYYAVVPKA